jgi:hypothetical protein
MNSYDVIFFGLWTEICAGVVFASSFMLKTPEATADEVAMRFGQNIAMFRSALFQRAEAWCGAVLLVVGFALQLTGTYWSAVEPSGLGLLNSVPRLLGGGSLVGCIVGVILFAARRDAQDRFLEHVFADLKPEERDSAVPPNSAFRMAYLWGVKARSNETEDELASRLTERKREFVKRYSERARIHGMRTPAEMIRRGRR